MLFNINASLNNENVLKLLPKQMPLLVLLTGLCLRFSLEITKRNEKTMNLEQNYYSKGFMITFLHIPVGPHDIFCCVKSYATVNQKGQTPTRIPDYV